MLKSAGRDIINVRTSLLMPRAARTSRRTRNTRKTRTTRRSVGDTNKSVFILSNTKAAKKHFLMHGYKVIVAV